ncbi:MAG: nucleotidyltransferase domain-containing protein [Synechococcales bacterium]|nr:nucleotidyltransferase domain-containing protein [Synechococcales bacterium]
MAEAILDSRVLDSLSNYLRHLYGQRLARLVLFGSHARGDATPESDIDVLVVLKGIVNPSEEIKRTSEFIANLCLQENIVISRIFTSQERYETENSPFFLNVRREGIPL